MMAAEEASVKLEAAVKEGLIAKKLGLAEKLKRR